MSAEVTTIAAGELAAGPLGECQNLGEIVSTLETQAREQGRVICAVLVNGQRLTQEQEVSWAEMEKSEIESLAVETEATAELLQATIASQLQLIKELERIGLEAARAFRQLDFGTAQGLLIGLLDGCRTFTDSLVAVREADAIEGENSTWTKCERQFHQMMTEVLAAVEQNDLVLLADLLEYELANGLENWRTVLVALTKQVTC